MSFGGQIPRIRFRRGDIVTLGLRNAKDSLVEHGIDMQAVYASKRRSHSDSISTMTGAGRKARSPTRPLILT